MIIGLPLGFILSYILFAITCVGLIAGTQIAFGEPIFNIVNAFDKINNTFAVFVLILALNMGALAFVVFGNLFPAGLQMSSLFPKVLDVKKAGVLTAIIGTMILPWKLVENASTLFYFYSFIGSMFGPIAGIMLASFYVEHKQVINLEDIYVEEGNLGEFKSGYNKKAMLTLGISFVLTMSGAFLQSLSFLKTINDFAFFSGLIFSFIVYSVLSKLMKENN
ncbi:cytosine permease [Enterococcus termitis]